MSLSKKIITIFLFSITLSTTALADKFIPRPLGLTGQQQNANYYLHSYLDGVNINGFKSISQKIIVDSTSPSTFWALAWQWNNAPNGGYVGFQTNGQSEGEALFSIWNAASAVSKLGDCQSNSICSTFSGEGTGYHCYTPFTIQPGHTYQFSVKPNQVQGPAGWWNAFITDESTGQKVCLGAIRTTEDNLYIQQYLSSFIEYFGQAVSNISDVPRSITQWHPPIGQDDKGDNYSLIFQSTTRAYGVNAGNISPVTVKFGNK